MKAQTTGQISTGPILSAVFVDYDNIYLSLKRKNEDAAKRFAKDAASWLKGIESGRLLTATNSAGSPIERRIVLNRCYGNPVPRRNAADNSTDMNSFPFVRHHFLRSGFEVIDCPPLTAQLKNSADIRMVMDVRDMLGHETRFDEFILLSGDADFTPLLHRLRAHARRTVVYANDHTAAPYTAISDGEVREEDLLRLLLDGRVSAGSEQALAAAASAEISSGGPTPAQLDAIRREIVTEVLAVVRASTHPVPLEALADRAVRLIGHEKTVGSAWGGAGSFRDLLAKTLPMDVRLSETAPYYVFDTGRHLTAAPRPEKRLEAPRVEPRQDVRYEPTREPRLEARPAPAAPQPLAPTPQQQAARQELAPRPQYETAGYAPPPAYAAPAAQTRPAAPSAYEAPQARMPLQAPTAQAPAAPAQAQPQAQLQAQAPAAPAPAAQAPAAQAPQARAPRAPEPNNAIRQSITRIHEACQAPPLAPPEYRALFEVMAEEITANGLAGSQTLINIMNRGRELGVEVRRDDVRFVLEVVSEPDPWFEQGASANLFASRFRNFVVARCRSQGLNLSSDEIDLIDAWFGGSPVASRAAAPAAQQRGPQQQAPSAPYQTQPQQAAQAGGDRWWSLDEGRNQAAVSREDTGAGGTYDEEFPRIIRSRLRG